jgi:hypothetical protein
MRPRSAAPSGAVLPAVDAIRSPSFCVPLVASDDVATEEGSATGAISSRIPRTFGTSCSPISEKGASRTHALYCPGAVNYVISQPQELPVRALRSGLEAPVDAETGAGITDEQVRVESPPFSGFGMPMIMGRRRPGAPTPN